MRVHLARTFILAVAVGTDGSLFVSDDLGGAIYRIRPSGR